MSNEKIIEEFKRDTPIWHILKEFHNKPCSICGVIPDNLLELSKALSAQKQEFKRVVDRVVGYCGFEGVEDKVFIKKTDILKALEKL